MTEGDNASGKQMATGAGRTGGVFYGWWIVLAGSLINSVGTGIILYGFTVFFLPLQRELALSSAAISLIYGASRLEGGIEGPLVGYLIDRIGPRKMIFCGCLLVGSGLILLSMTTSFLTLFLVYVLVIATGLGAGCFSPVSAVFNSWFIRRRGTVFGILVAAGSLGGMVMAPVLSYFALNYSWRTSAVIAGVIVLAVSLPSMLLMHKSPESRGLQPDGGPPRKKSRQPSADIGDSPSEVDFSVREALKTRAYWLLTLGVSLRMFVTMALVAHLIPMLVWRGVEEGAAAYMVSLYSFLSILAMLAAGWLGDRVSKTLLCSMAMAATGVCMIVPTLSDSSAALLLIPIGLAFSMGSVPLNWSLIGDFFGRRKYATLRGIMGVGMGVAQFVSPVYTGWMYDRTGSYAIVLVSFAVSTLLTAGLFAVLKRPARRPEAATAPV